MPTPRLQLYALKRIGTSINVIPGGIYSTQGSQNIFLWICLLITFLREFNAPVQFGCGLSPSISDNFREYFFSPRFLHSNL